MCENLVGAFRDGLRKTFDLSKKKFYTLKSTKIYAKSIEYMQVLYITEKRLWSGCLRLRDIDRSSRDKGGQKDRVQCEKHIEEILKSTHNKTQF